jgi:hypothetical protein
MFRKVKLRIVMMILPLGLVMSCASTDLRIPKNPDPIIKGDITQEKAEIALRMKLRKQMDFLEANKEQYRKQIVKIPSGQESYYYKYYDEFPGDREDVIITIVPTGEFSPMYRADVKYHKVRYQTRYTKSDSGAKADNDFIRDQGMQNEQYEFDREVWQLKNSTFEVTKTSVYDNNKWTASQKRIRRVEDDKPELFVDKVRTLFGLLE